jgi:hypothetical protein
MRDLTKSVFSFSWAMSLFGIQQAANLFTPSKAARAFDNVTGATREQFCDVTKAAFRAGDNMQRGMLEMMFGVLSGQMLDPSRWTRGAADAARQAASAAGQGMRAAAAPAQQRPFGGSQQTGGWGAAPGQDAGEDYSHTQEQGGWGASQDSGCDPCGRRR